MVAAHARRDRAAIFMCSQRLSPIPTPPGMKRTQWEHKRSRLLYRRLAQPLQSSGGRGWRARMYELGGAKQAGSTYAHGGPAGKRGKSLRAHRNFPSLDLPFSLGLFNLNSAVDNVTIFLGNKSLISFNLPLLLVPISNFSIFFFNIWKFHIFLPYKIIWKKNKARITQKIYLKKRRK